MDGIVDHIVSSLLTSVSQILVRETNLILNARDQLEALQGELRFINQFLRNSTGKRENVKEEVNQIQDVALEAEDLIDDFVVKMAMYKRRSTLHKFFHGGEQLKLLWNVAVQIKRINNKIKLIHGNKEKYNITSNDSAVPSTKESEKALIQRHRRNVEENEVVGFNNEAQLVLKKLDTWDSRTDVVSIIGMGGLGKSTLARKIYNGSFVRQCFDCRAWVDVSRDYNLRELALKIANSLFSSEEMKEIDGLTEEKLVQKLVDRLAVKRYMIVLDDVWDKQLWDGIKNAFPDNGKKSRVLITSRFKEVALHASVRTPPHFLPLLNEDDSWKLFSMKVSDDQVCPPKLEQLARQQILTKCKGLPLAIVLAAGLLKTKEEYLWTNVASDLNRFLAEDPTGCLAILALSYDDLPPHLKPCFLYFGVFPEDFNIPVRELIRIWLAEGFVDQEINTNLDMEDMAEVYLSQLIDRSLIQVVRTRTDGGVKSCRIHDLLRDLTISEGIREKFFLLDTNGSSSLSASNKPIRRLSIHYGSRDIGHDFLSVSKFSQLRSILSFGGESIDMEPDLSLKDPFSCLSKFCPYLRVLHFGSALHHNCPPKVEKLVQLRYFKLNTPYVRQILPPLSKLPNLQTLDLKHSPVHNFTANPCEMQQLRHLRLFTHHQTHYQTRFHVPKGNGNTAMPNLHTLSSLSVFNEDDVAILKMVPNLKKLSFSINNDELVVLEDLSKLQHLRTLKVENKLRWTNQSALPLSLTKVTLSFTYLPTSAFSQLGRHPNLQVLKLQLHSLKGSKIECGSDQGLFPRLEVLHLVGLKDLEWWSMEGGGLQSLVYLSIHYCLKLKAIPDQLKQLTTLRQFKVDACPSLKRTVEKMWVNDARFKHSGLDVDVDGSTHMY